jgi:hypothetical protein
MPSGAFWWKRQYLDLLNGNTIPMLGTTWILSSESGEYVPLIESHFGPVYKLSEAELKLIDALLVWIGYDKPKKKTKRFFD